MFGGAVCQAQNFNESVEVTNDLVVDLSGSTRKTIDMEVPDSVSRFDLNFDYSVFAKPYQGAYEFTPYNVLFRPVTALEKRPQLYLSAGAGYAFTPELTAVWSPRTKKGKFYLDIYQDFDGYLGKYNGNGSYYSGYDLNELFGVHGRSFLKYLDLDFNAFYNGIWARDFALSGMGYQSFGGQLTLGSGDREVKALAWAVNADYHLGIESDAPASFTENAVKVSGFFAPVFVRNIDPAWNLKIDYKAGGVFFGGDVNDSAGYLSLEPKVEYAKDKVHARAGFKFWFCEGVGVIPDVEVSYLMFKKSLNLYAGVTGDTFINSYYDYKTANHHFSSQYFTSETAGAYVSQAREIVNAHIGVRGCVSSYLEYGAKAGYAIRANSPLYGLVDADSNQALLVLGKYGYWYVNPSVTWKSRSVEVNADALFRDVKLKGDYDVFTPESFRAHLDVTCNSMNRMFAGISLDYVGPRTSQVYASRPGYFDLGLHAEARLTSEITLWLRGGNLLNQKVEDVPFTGRRLPCATLGIRMILR